MQALILAGGHGNRVKKFTNKIKPLMTIANQSILSIQLESLRKYNISINCNKEHEKILQQYGSLIIEEKRLGNATPIKKFAEQTNDNFIVIHCDILNNINVDRMLNEHIKSNCSMTIAVKNIVRYKSFGVTVFNQNKYVTGFTRNRFVNCGFYICKSDIGKYILNNTFQDIDRDLIPSLIKKNQIKVYIHSGYWYDVGSSDYLNRHRKNLKKETIKVKSSIGEKSSV